NDASKFFWQIHPLPQPVNDERFQFSRSRTCAPGHSVDVQWRGHDFAQNSRPGLCPTEIPKKHWMTPMHHSRNNQPIDVAQNFIKRFAFFGRLRWQRRSDRARFVVRRDTQAGNVFPKIGDPISKLMKLFPENSRLGITERLSILHCYLPLPFTPER